MHHHTLLVNRECTPHYTATAVVHALDEAHISKDKPKWYQDLVVGMTKHSPEHAEDYAKHFVTNAIKGLQILHESGEAFVSLATSGEYALVAKKQGASKRANLVDKD
jgi:hypothetical protein